MEAQSALIGADGAVELHTVTQVHLHLTLVIHPRHAERDDPLRLHDTLDNLGLLKLGMLVIHIFDGFQHFPYSL